VDATVFGQHGMELDDVGASMSTYGGLSSYAASGPDAPLEVHRFGYELLRLHSKTQLNTEAFRKAYNAVRAAYAAAGGEADVAPHTIRIYHPYKSADSGLPDGTRYVFDRGSKRLSLRMPLRKDGPSVNDLLREAGIPREAVQWFAGDNESAKRWLAVRPDYALAVAAAIESSYPELARAVRQNAPIWMREANVTPAAITATSDAFDANGGVVGREGAWAHDTDPPQLRVTMRDDMRGLFTRAGLERGRDWQFWKDQGGVWWVVAPEAGAERIAAALEASGKKGMAAAIRQAIPLWAATKAAAPAVAVEPTALPVLSDAEKAALHPIDGKVDGVQYEWSTHRRTLSLLFPVRTGGEIKAIMGEVPFGWEPRDPRTGQPCGRGVAGCVWWIGVNLLALKRLPAQLATRYPRLAAAIAHLLESWDTGERAALRHTEEAGETEDGRWRTMPDGSVRLYLSKNAAAKGWQHKVPNTRVDWGRDAEGDFYWTFRKSKALKVAEVVKQWWPKVGEAMTRSFGGVAEVYGEEESADAARCAMLGAMSSAGRPEDVTDPAAREHVEHVVRVLKQRLPYGAVPLPFQFVGTAFARATGYRTLIADEQGLGKTPQSLCTIAVDPEILLPAVVVCPAVVFYNWRNEARKWLPTVQVYELTTGTTPLPPPAFKGIVLVTWNLLAKHAARLAKWGPKLIIADEAQNAKEPATGWSKALAGLAQTTPHLLLLSGTPIKNRAIEIHHLLWMLDPLTWGKRNEFGRKYAEEKQIKLPTGQTITVYEGGQNLAELNQRLKCVMVRRLKEHVLTDLPPKTRTYLPIELSAAERREYDKAHNEFVSWLQDAMPKRVAAEMAALGADGTLSAEQIAVEAQQRVARALKAEAIVKLGKLRMLVGLAKIPYAIEHVQSFVEAEEPIVVFAHHREVVGAIAAALAKAGVAHGVIDGSTSKEEKTAIVQRFQSGQIHVVVGSMSMATGVTLTRATNTLFVERWWTPGDEEQGEDRIHRITQERPVTIWYLHADRTIDDSMRILIEGKRSTAREAVGGTIVPVTEADRDRAQGDLLAALAGLRKLAVPADALVKETPEAHDARVRQNPLSGAATARRLPAPETIHALLFDRTAWAAGAAAHWARMNDLPVVGGAEPAGPYHKVTVQDTSRFVPGSFRTVALDDTIRAILAKPTGGPTSRGRR
jgi:superfamily II DNA or RNA helicase